MAKQHVVCLTPAQRQAAGAFGVGGGGRAVQPRASHGNLLHLGEPKL